MSSDTMTMPTHMNGAPASSTYSHRSRGNTYTEGDPIHQYARILFEHTRKQMDHFQPSSGHENDRQRPASSSNNKTTTAV